jgi:hypothetical protein
MFTPPAKVGAVLLAPANHALTSARLPERSPFAQLGPLVGPAKQGKNRLD